MEILSGDHSLTFRVLSTLSGKDCGAIMKANVDQLRELDRNSLTRLFGLLRSDDFTTGQNPSFMRPGELKRFQRKIENGNFDGAAVYLQNRSGMSAQMVLNDILKQFKEAP